VRLWVVFFPICLGSIFTVSRSLFGCLQTDWTARCLEDEDCSGSLLSFHIATMPQPCHLPSLPIERQRTGIDRGHSTRCKIGCLDPTMDLINLSQQELLGSVLRSGGTSIDCSWERGRWSLASHFGHNVQAVVPLHRDKKIYFVITKSYKILQIILILFNSIQFSLFCGAHSHKL